MSLMFVDPDDREVADPDTPRVSCCYEQRPVEKFSPLCARSDRIKPGNKDRQHSQAVVPRSRYHQNAADNDRRKRDLCPVFAAEFPYKNESTCKKAQKAPTRERDHIRRDEQHGYREVQYSHRL